jgi:hypothetical protein
MRRATTRRILEQVKQLEETAAIQAAADTADPRIQALLIRQAERLAELDAFAELARRVDRLEAIVARLDETVQQLARRLDAEAADPAATSNA